MKRFLHAFRTTFLRFRTEITGYWIFAIFLIIAYQAGWIVPDPFPVFPYQARIALARIELLAVLWLTLRLMFSEPIFMAQGGWRVRPSGRFAVGVAPFAVLAAVLLPPVLLRMAVVQASFSPGLREWRNILEGVVFPAAGVLVLLALVLRICGIWLSNHVGAMRKIVPGILCIAVLAAWFIPQSRRYLWSHDGRFDRFSNMDSGSYSEAAHVLGIQELLPPDSDFVGDWETYAPPVFRVKEVFRFPLAEGSTLRQPGLKLEIANIEPRGHLLGVEMSFTTVDPELLEDVWRGTMVLRYHGNIHAFRPKRSDWMQRPPLLLMPGTKMNFSGFFDSPLERPTNKRTWDELLQGAEVIIYRRDETVPKITHLNHRKALPEKEDLPPGVAGEVQQIFDRLDHDPEQNEAEKMAARIKELPAAAIPSILARRPWSDQAWDKLVKPVLIRHAGEGDKTGLLERLEFEPRLGGILVMKGWKTEAMPMLRHFAEERLPMDVVSLGALAEEKDAALAPALSSLCAALGKEVEELEPKLREVPGFDWQAFVKEGWLRNKYDYRSPHRSQAFSYWAAREGDFSALRYTAQEAARGAGPEMKQLASLVVDVNGDLLTYLRENIDRMEFDGTSKRWRARQ